MGRKGRKGKRDEGMEGCGLVEGVGLREVLKAGGRRKQGRREGTNPEYLSWAGDFRIRKKNKKKEL